MYNDYFGLREAPFSIAPNPQYLFMSPRHREALAHLLYGIQSDGGFILLTGEVGTGKTTVCRCLLEQIPEDVDTAYILNPKQTAQELLATACDEFKVDYPEGASIKVLVDLLNAFLLNAHQAGRKTVLIIDEAQNLSVDVLEQLRLLTNLETNQRKLLQIILLGQPELLTLLARQELRQLSQRVTARFHLDALNRDEVADYIQHRLDIAGAKGSLFPPATVKRIFQISNGIPRLINLVSDRALLGTYVQNKLQVDVATVNNAAKEILGPQQPRKVPWLPAAAAALVIGAIGFAITLWQPAAPTNKTEVTAITPPPTAPVENELRSEIEQQTPTDPELLAEPLTEAVVTTEADPEPIETLPAEELITPEIARQKLAGTQGMALLQPQSSTITTTDLAPELGLRTLSEVPGYADQLDAFNALFEIWGSELPNNDAVPCDAAAVSGLQCLTKLGSLRDIAHMNRPVILSLRTPGQNDWYLITRVAEDHVEITTEGTTYQLPNTELLSAWSGFYTLLWRSPPAYREPVRRGDKGATVDWLQAQLAMIDGGDVLSVEPGTEYNAQMETQVKRFQISVGLVPDGIVGPQTWIHLNSTDATNIPRLDR